MAQVKRQRNNTIAGFFVLSSILGFVVLIVILSDISGFGEHHEYEIWFSPDLGTPGLESGAAVTLAGFPIGRVTEVTPVFDNSPSTDNHIKVVISLPEEYVIHQGTVAGLVIPMIGSGASINIEDLTTGAAMGPDDHLDGIYAPSPFLRSAGIGPKQIAQVQDVIANVELISNDVVEVAEFARSEVQVSGREIIDRITEVVRQVNEVVASAREAWPEWSARVTSIMTKGDEAADSAKALLDDGRSLVANANEGVTDVRETIDDVSTKISDSAENIRSLTARANDEWSEKVTFAIDAAQARVEQVSGMLEEVNASLTTGLPEVARILGNMRLASDNLKLAMIEIRSEPWRLLAAPSERGLEETLFYDSVRTYANAVSDLDASIAALKALRERYGDQFDPESDPVKRILELLDANYTKFEAAEESLYDFVLENTGDSNP